MSSECNFPALVILLQPYFCFKLSTTLSNLSCFSFSLLSNKDITFYLLEEQGKQNTAELFKSIITLLELPSSTFEEKIGDYYTSLTTDKRFIMLEDGCWDLRSRHTSDKIAKMDDEDEEDEEETEDTKDDMLSDELEEDNYDSGDVDDDDDYVDSNEDLKDLVVVDEEELENE